MKGLLTFSIFILFFSEIILLYVTDNLNHLFLGILLFFISFNLIEGILPSMLSKETPRMHKGVTVGIFSTSQFLGITIGGIFGGYLLNIFNIEIIFYTTILIVMIWFSIIFKLKEPL